MNCIIYDAYNARLAHNGGGGITRQRQCAWCINCADGCATTVLAHYWPTASYVRCLNCNARGPLKVIGACLSDEAASAAWNGEDPQGPTGVLFA